MKAIVCRNCVYYSNTLARNQVGDPEEWGICKYNPPTPAQDLNGNYIELRPKVDFDDWCGMYKEKKNDADRGQIESELGDSIDNEPARTPDKAVGTFVRSGGRV